MPTPRAHLATHLTLLAAVGLASCAAPREHRLDPARPTSLTLPLQGTYVATLAAPYVGPINARFQAQPTDEGFRATTRPGVAWDLIGGITGLVGRFVAPFLFPGGIILTWESTLPTADAPGQGRIQVGGISGASVRTVITNTDQPVVILTTDGRDVASFSLRPEFAQGHTPQNADALGDYPALADAAADALSRRLYDPDLARSTQVRSYLAQLRSNAALARDDVEFIFGSAIAGRNNLSTSLPLIFKAPSDDSVRLLTAFRASGNRSPIRVEFDNEQHIATLRADAFIDASDVDAAMNAVLAHQPPVRGLVIDLWQTPGVTLASLALLPWLLEAPTDVGQVVGPQQRSAVLAGDASALDPVTIAHADDIDRLEGLVDLGGSAALRVVPRPDRFTGPVAVIISRRTTTTAEPIAWTLQRTGRARLFGRPTPGRPLVSRPADLGQGWVVWLPAAEWRDTSGRPRPLELGRGVRPSESHDRSPARDAARRWLTAHPNLANAP